MTRTPCPVVLVVEDDPPIRNLIAAVLTMSGYEVLTAADGLEALASAEKSSAGIDLLLTDVMMPGMDGVTLAARLQEASPRTRVLLMSGYNTALNRAKASQWPFLAKPFVIQRLLRSVADALSPEQRTERRA